MRPHQHYVSCQPGDACWPMPTKRSLEVSVFGREWAPRIVHFYVAHWLEIVSLAEASSEESVRNLREALRYEFDHLRLGSSVVCRCGELNFPTVVHSGGGGGRSFSDIVPSIETAYKALPIAWRGRTKVYLMFLGHSEDAIYLMRQDRPARGAMSTFDRYHMERMRSEMRSPGFRAKPQDSDEEESESPWRRMAAALGWVSPEERALALVANVEQDERQAA